MLKTQNLPIIVEAFTDTVTCLDVLNTFLLAGQRDGSVSLWDLAHNKKLFTKLAHNGKVNSVVLTSKLQMISAGSDSLIKFLTYKNIFEIEAHYLEVNCLLISHDERQLFSGSSDKSIKIWNILNKASRLAVLHGHKLPVLTLTRSKNSQFLFSASTDEIFVWNLQKLRVEYLLEGHSGYVNSLVLNDSETQLFSAGSDKLIKVWNLDKRRFLYNFKGHEGEVKHLGLDRNFLFSYGTDLKLRVWNLNSKIAEKVLQVEPVSCLKVIGKVFVAFEDSTLKVLDTESLRQVKGIMGHRGGLCKVLNFEDWVISAGNDGLVKVWDRFNVMKVSFEAHGNGVLDIDVDRKEGVLASVGGDGFVRIWKLEDWSRVKEFRIHTTIGNKIKFLSQNRIIMPLNHSAYQIHNLKTGAYKIFIRASIKKQKSVSFTKSPTLMVIRKSKYDFMVLKIPN